MPLWFNINPAMLWCMVTAFQVGVLCASVVQHQPCNAVVYGHSVSGSLHEELARAVGGLQRCGVWSQLFQASFMLPGAKQRGLQRCGVWSQRFRASAALFAVPVNGGRPATLWCMVTAFQVPAAGR